MKMLAFSIYDDKAQVYSRPFYAITIGEAIRTFTDAVNQKDSPYNRHPDDYTLYSVGSFDDALGELENTMNNNLGGADSYLERPAVISLPEQRIA